MARARSVALTMAQGGSGDTPNNTRSAKSRPDTQTAGARLRSGRLHQVQQGAQHLPSKGSLGQVGCHVWNVSHDPGRLAPKTCHRLVAPRLGKQGGWGRHVHAPDTHRWTVAFWQLQPRWLRRRRAEGRCVCCLGRATTVRPRLRHHAPSAAQKSQALTHLDLVIDGPSQLDGCGVAELRQLQALLSCEAVAPADPRLGVAGLEVHRAGRRLCGARSLGYPGRRGSGKGCERNGSAGGCSAIVAVASSFIAAAVDCGGLACPHSLGATT